LAALAENTVMMPTAKLKLKMTTVTAEKDMHPLGEVF
jgi:hypothetical protein